MAAERERGREGGGRGGEEEEERGEERITLSCVQRFSCKLEKIMAACSLGPWLIRSLYKMRSTSCVDVRSIVQLAEDEAMKPTDLLSEQWRGFQKMLICARRNIGC